MSSWEAFVSLCGKAGKSNFPPPVIKSKNDKKDIILNNPGPLAQDVTFGIYFSSKDNSSSYCAVDFEG